MMSILNIFDTIHSLVFRVVEYTVYLYGSFYTNIKTKSRNTRNYESLELLLSAESNASQRSVSWFDNSELLLQENDTIKRFRLRFLGKWIVAVSYFTPGYLWYGKTQVTSYELIA